MKRFRVRVRVTYLEDFEVEAESKSACLESVLYLINKGNKPFYSAEFLSVTEISD